MTHQEPNAYSNPARGGAATIWRHGFAYGFRDALRSVARELGPETGSTLDELADRYDLAVAND